MKEISRKIKRSFLSFLDSFKSTEQVFSEIYKKNRWGGKKGQFCSGDGSSNIAITGPYIDKIMSLSEEFDFARKTCVDLGCGDFQIGSKISGLFRNYIGVDIVSNLIEYNRNQHGSEKIQFKKIDITNENLPSGNVCFLRQVLQHLSNRQIIEIIKKLSQYEISFITEHVPSTENILKYNLDKSHGSTIRLFNGSGVFLWMPPFNLPESKLTKILELKSPPIGNLKDSGLITTYMYLPNN
jgi:hypothetical protein